MNEENNKKSNLKDYLQYSAVGLEMGLAVIFGVLIGSYLDEKLDTEPWMLFFWLICGFVAGMRSIIKLMKKHIKEIKKKEESNAAE